MRTRASTTALMVAALTLACGTQGAGADAPAVIDPGDGGDYHATLDPNDTVATIDNPYLPFLPGSRWVYEGEEDGEVERVVVEVTDLDKTVMGIDAVVVHDVVTVDGEVIEDTFDWYTQDTEGNVWYLGEDTTEFENGEPVSHEGSWEAGVDGAQPGIVMLADPEKGDAYRQEFAPGEAEDMAEVRHTDVKRSTELDRYDEVLATWEWTPLEPDIVEEKDYAPGIGLVLEVVKRGGKGRMELVEFTTGD